MARLRGIEPRSDDRQSPIISRYTITPYGCFDNPGRASWGGKLHPLILRQNVVPTFIVKG